MTTGCCLCSKKFTLSKYRFNRSEKIYCSMRCYGISQREKINVVCLFCGRKFYRVKSHDSKKVFCNLKHKSKWMEAEAVKRFYNSINRTSTCWNWTGPKDGQTGYGIFSGFKKHQRLAHRYSYMVHIGQIQKGKWVLHNCDNPSCVNPMHLRVGTVLDNNRDKADRNRSLFGERNNKAKLKFSDIPVIRSLYIPRKMSYPKLAALYNVFPTTIGKVIRRETWVKTPE